MDLIALKEARHNGGLVPFLQKFNAANATVLDFSKIDFFCRKELVNVVETAYAEPEWDNSLSNALLNTLRLIARDEKNVEVVYESELVQKYILGLAGLSREPNHPVVPQLRLEATKCLVNSLFKSTCMQNAFGKEAQSGLRESLSVLVANRTPSPDDIFLYNLSLRVLFITTAVQVPIRALWKEDVYFQTLLKIIDQALGTSEFPLQDRITLANEVLKTLFSLFCKKDPREDLKKTTEALVRVKSLLYSPLAVDADLSQNCVNLISTLPEVPDVICPKVSPEQPSDLQLEGRDMTTIQYFLDKLEQRIDENDLSLVAIYLTAILGYCTVNAQVRRYVRLKVLPPLKETDVERLPDEGETLRNKLIRIMKGLGNASSIASQLMFVLCKQSVGRMIKYTGFGHAAGLLANKQLLGQINQPKNEENSEDSETEEYAAVEDKVNPVTGCIRPQDKKSPFDGMSEEQKEYEAVKLMNAMNKMLDAGVIKPGTLDADGKVRALSHILEMTKNIQLEDKDSDSD